MKGLVLQKPDSYPVLKDFELEDDNSKVKVRMIASAMNHRDVWITKGLYPGIKYPIILGSDGVGEYKGKRVVLNPGQGWGGDEAYQDLNFHILGLPTNGTFAEEVMVIPHYIHEAPGHLSDVEAAALPLAGLTAYRALMVKACPKPGDKVLVTGIGGGVALFALQFASSLGLDVYVTSGSREKIESAKRLGAKEGVIYKDEDWIRQLAKINPAGFDIIIDGAGGSGFGNMMKVCNPGARMVIYGGTRGKIESLNPQLIFWKQISVMGSTMGSEKDFKNMIEFVNKYKIKPVVDKVFRFDQAEEAFGRMDAMSQFGKIVFQNS